MVIGFKYYFTFDFNLSASYVNSLDLDLFKLIIINTEKLMGSNCQIDFLTLKPKDLLDWDSCNSLEYLSFLADCLLRNYYCLSRRCKSFLASNLVYGTNHFVTSFESSLQYDWEEFTYYFNKNSIILIEMGLNQLPYGHHFLLKKIFFYYDQLIHFFYDRPF